MSALERSIPTNDVTTADTTRHAGELAQGQSTQRAVAQSPSRSALDDTRSLHAAQQLELGMLWIDPSATPSAEMALAASPR
jgi:hypothetical protein